MLLKARLHPARVFYGWWVAIAFFVINLYWGGALLQGFTVFFNPIRTSLGLSATLVTLAVQLRSVVAMVGSPIVGALFDRFGPRPLMLGSAVVTAGGMLYLSSASSTLTFFLALLLTATGSSVWMAGTGPAAMTNWFVRHRGKAIGFILAGISLGGVLIPAMVWMEARWGWQGLARAVAAGLLLVCVPLSLVLRHRPEQHGLLPDGDPPGQAAMAAASLSPAADPSPAPHRSAPDPEGDFTFRESLRTPALWALVMAQAATSIGGQATMLFFIPHLQADAGIRPAVAALALTAVAFLGVIGQPFFGWLADTFNKRLVLAISSGLTAGGVIVFALVKEPWQLIPFAVLYGLTARTGFAVLVTILAEYFGRANFGKVQGVVLSVTSLIGTVAALGVAAAFDATESYVTAFLVIGSLEFTSLLFLLGARKPRRRGSVHPA